MCILNSPVSFHSFFAVVWYVNLGRQLRHFCWILLPDLRVNISQNRHMVTNADFEIYLGLTYLYFVAFIECCDTTLCVVRHAFGKCQG